jgi:TPR repeat protein
MLLFCGVMTLGACAKKGDTFYAVERYDAAADLYIQSAEQGDVTKMMRLARMYASGKIDYHRDYQQAAYWYTKAAGKGIVPAMFELGFIYEYGQGNVDRDPVQAQHWYALAAARGNAYAQYRLAHIQAEQLTDTSGDAAVEAYEGFLRAAQMAKDCTDKAECRIINGDLFNYRWQLERHLSDEQKQQARQQLGRKLAVQAAE